MTTPTDEKIDAAMATLVTRAPISPPFPDPLPHRRRGGGIAALVVVPLIVLGVVLLADRGNDSVPVAADSADSRATDGPAGPTSDGASSSPDDEVTVAVIGAADPACAPESVVERIRDLAGVTVTEVTATATYDGPAVHTDDDSRAAARRIAELFDPPAQIEALVREQGSPVTTPLPDDGGATPSIVVTLGHNCATP